MANWCMTNVQISGPKMEVFHLKDLLTKWISTCNIENGLGNTWLGNIADKAGLDYKKIECRGYIYSMNDIRTLDNGESALDFEVETAWRPMHEIWHYILDKYAPNCKYVYSAQEYGFELFETNDYDGKAFGEEHIYLYCGDTTEELREILDLEDGANWLTVNEFMDWGKEFFKFQTLTCKEIFQKLKRYIEKYDMENNVESYVKMYAAEYVEPW